MTLGGILLLQLLAPEALGASDPHANPPGDLRVEVVVSATADYIAEWVRTPFEQDIHIAPLRIVHPEQTFYMAVVTTGYSLDGEHMTHLTGGFKLKAPSGHVILNEPDTFVHRKRMTHPTGFVMFDPAIDLTLEHKDERGTYLIEAEVTDQVTGKTATDAYQVQLSDFQ